MRKTEKMEHKRPYHYALHKRKESSINKIGSLLKLIFKFLIKYGLCFNKTLFVTCKAMTYYQFNILYNIEIS